MAARTNRKNPKALLSPISNNDSDSDSDYISRDQEEGGEGISPQTLISYIPTPRYVPINSTEKKKNPLVTASVEILHVKNNQWPPPHGIRVVVFNADDENLPLSSKDVESQIFEKDGRITYVILKDLFRIVNFANWAPFLSTNDNYQAWRRRFPVGDNLPCHGLPIFLAIDFLKKYSSCKNIKEIKTALESHNFLKLSQSDVEQFEKPRPKKDVKKRKERKEKKTALCESNKKIKVQEGDEETSDFHLLFKIAAKTWGEYSEDDRNKLTDHLVEMNCKYMPRVAWNSKK